MITLATLIGLLGALSLSPQAHAIEKIKPHKKGVALVNKLLKALSNKSADARLKAILPLMHKSTKRSGGDDLKRTVKNYSYKKATQNVKFYAMPAKITEVHKGRTVTVGYRDTAERGRRDKYFVGKKKGVAGRPAPIHVFWPQKGGAPRILDIGSL